MSSQNLKPKKHTGPIRWNAIIPFTAILVVIVLYMHFFFDLHLRKTLEWAGYQALGSEINIGNLETSFFNASLKVQKIEVTNSEKPSLNSIEIGEIRFSMLWDALLRVKFVINEAVVEQIEFGTQRKSPGKVKPPEPESNEPSLVASEAEKLKAQGLKEAQSKYEDNVLGDAVAMLGGSNSEAQLEKLKESLPSKAMLEKFDSDLKAKQGSWDQRLKTLPQGKEIQELGDRLNKIKYKDFSSPQELQASLQQLDTLFKDADAKYKQIQSVSDDLSKDLKNLETQYRDIEKQVQVDIKSLEKHFKIPQLNAKAMTLAIFNRYLAPYRTKFDRYKAMAEKYLPPKYTKKGAADKGQAEEQLQPHPREKGISYEFGRPNSYPLVWVKHVGISSQAGLSPEAGDIKGDIYDITTHQSLVGKPTIATVAGDFPGMKILGLLLKLSLDNRSERSKIEYLFNVKSYPLAGKELVQTPEVNIAFKNATGGLGIQGHLIGLKELNLNFDNQFSNIAYEIKAQNEIADQILKAVFADIPVVTLNAQGNGTIPNVALAVNSNIGTELQKGFEKQIQAKIDEARKKIDAQVQQEIGKLKAQVDGELNKMRSQYEGEVKKAQAQLDTQKKQAEAKVEQSKKDAENQGRKKLEEEGKKALDDLKKKFGL